MFQPSSTKKVMLSVSGRVLSRSRRASSTRTAVDIVTLSADAVEGRENSSTTAPVRSVISSVGPGGVPRSGPDECCEPPRRDAARFAAHRGERTDAPLRLCRPIRSGSPPRVPRGDRPAGSRARASSAWVTRRSAGRPRRARFRRHRAVSTLVSPAGAARAGFDTFRSPGSARPATSPFRRSAVGGAPDLSTAVSERVSDDSVLHERF